MRDFPTMTEVVPEGRHGEATVEHFVFSKEESDFTRVRAAFGHPHEFCPPGTYARLRMNGRIWMTDTRMERESNRDVLWAARGRVLIGGLGLGMVVAGLLKKPSVTHITVIERHPDVIALVEPALQQWAGLDRADVLTVEQGDIFYWRPPARVKYDTIYFDVWEHINYDDQEWRKLKRKYRGRLAPGGWIGAWMQEDF